MRHFNPLTLCAVAVLASCDRATPRPAPTAPLSAPAATMSAAGFTTSAAPQAYALVRRAKVRPIITVGDRLPSGYVFAPIPDGLGAYGEGVDLVVYANHELSAGGVQDVNGVPQYRFARVSRLVIDPATLAVNDATYVLDGSELYQRLCSATWVDAAEGFPSGYFLTGEESTGGAHDGMQLAIGKDGQHHELPWLGRYAHENMIGVPGFPGRVVLAGFDDTRGNSELYLYVAGSEADVLSGTGRLYVFTSAAVSHAGHLREGQTITGRFVEIPSPGGLSSAQLQTTVSALGAFPFVRLEDGDYEHRSRPLDDDDDHDRIRAKRRAPAMYFVDTGSESVMCGATACDPYGSIYRMEFERNDPTARAGLTLLQRSRGADLEWASPDNIALGKNSLMVNEDPAYSGFARAPRVWNFKTSARGTLVDRGTAVVELTNPDCVDARGTCWESSGIIDASAWLGAGAWLFDVQAHTLRVPSLGLRGEGGQLLVLRLPGS
ncbi:MAG: hypothetical protein ACREMM_05855 [Gemmatimonadales bacterium]